MGGVDRRDNGAAAGLRAPGWVLSESMPTTNLTHSHLDPGLDRHLVGAYDLLNLGFAVLSHNGWTRIAGKIY